ncbi:MAG: L-rhamnose isomerase, partial [Eubacteriales bacterium]
WVTGVRNMQKALLFALLIPHDKLRKLQDEGKFTRLLVMSEDLKAYPFGDIWTAFCKQQKVQPREDWLNTIEQYEKDVLSKRV